MTNVDITTCKDILFNVGTQLWQKYGELPTAQDRTELAQRIHEANQWAASSIRTALESVYPTIHWSFSELELSKQQRAEFDDEYWVCDPVDGAVHLHQGFAFWSMSLCLIRNGEPVLSMIYDPSRQEFFHAVAGQGAYLQGRRIQVSSKIKGYDAMIATAPPSAADQDLENTQRTASSLARLMPQVGATRMLGSVALQLAYVACGRLDGYWEFGSEFYDWVSGALLIREAGGVVSDMYGNAFTWGATGIIAGSPGIHDMLTTEIKSASQNQV
ncbi:inositol monophosphatase family protein [Alicyclobacillus sp. ALC3]|uniref:inositol monophosphatase family protein n=1 Tax=Alicyclobacillus sp. ALC3 TaxID=2796143 RepID=UPI002379AD4D|nr:inositol monophosphatase family protein [Alicyclobacillus sp. ALC3]WDL98437.1 inositol monophosphatase [Alicyclobacillus sp. ALC3]